ncbi:MAG TPA: EamA/RhaT family transporter [Rhodanobacteraceae bacterium]
MLYIALSVVCSVVVSILLKLAPRYAIDVRQAIAGNYLVAALLTVAILRPDLHALATPDARAAWPVLVALGIVLPTIFAVLAKSVRSVGIVRTDAAQRLSLVLSLLAAFTLFGEAFTWHWGAGLALGLAAIGCVVIRPGTDRTGRNAGHEWWWPALVFAGVAATDILYKRVAQLTSVPFASILLATFVLAFVLALAAMAWLYGSGRARFAWRNAGGAVALGLFNFGDILCYVQAQRQLPQQPALVFSLEDIGVIVLATLVGVGWFGERLGRLNRVGLALAVAAVLVLAAA